MWFIFMDVIAVLNADHGRLSLFVPIRQLNGARGGGDDDYDVCDGDKVIGRIVRHPQAPTEAPWFWVIVAQARKRSLPDRGYAVSREQAMAQFRTQWSRDDLVCPRIADLPTLPMPDRSLRSVQRPNLGRLEQSKRREADLFAMRQECLAKSIMIRRYKADPAFRRSPVIYPCRHVVGAIHAVGH